VRILRSANLAPEICRVSGNLSTRQRSAEGTQQLRLQMSEMSGFCRTREPSGNRNSLFGAEPNPGLRQLHPEVVPASILDSSWTPESEFEKFRCL
jgi:hypothetical protein